MKEVFKKFTKFFGNDYIKYWYVFFGITIILMYVDYINNRGIDKFKYIQYDNSGKVIHEEIISINEIAIKLKTPGQKAFEPIKKIF